MNFWRRTSKRGNDMMLNILALPRHSADHSASRNLEYSPEAYNWKLKLADVRRRCDCAERNARYAASA